MKDVLYLAWRYVAHHRFKTAVLVASVTVVLALPLGLRVLLDRGADALTARAEATPLLVGAKGSPLELVLDALYFGDETPPDLAWSEVDRVASSGLATAIPLHTRFDAQGLPIVGTTVEYLEERDLVVERGAEFAILGDCVVGAIAARELGVDVGDRVVSSPQTVFDLAGVYPLAMRVTGVLAPSGGPDDRAVLCDVKTTWVIAGLAHGHEDLSKPEAASSVLSRDGDAIVANAAVRVYQEITEDNIEGFHFHGDPSGFPVSAILAVPVDQRSATILEGRYLSEDDPAQIVRPLRVMERLLDTVLTVRRYVTAAVAGIGLATLATMALVFLLSLQVRRREIATMVRLGMPRRRLAAVLACEVGAVLLTGVGLAAVVTLGVSRLGESAVRWIVELSA
ncbi:MAG: FtsX-like permease family protein [Planctomycetota bacterium]